MIILANSDLYKARTSSLVADYDRNTIVNLYQPIIGAIASALYFYLLAETENQKIIGSSTHEQLLLHMQLSTSEFLKARKVLEAVGLVKTFLQGYGDEVKLYEYQIFAPKTPKKFFEDTLLFGTLIQYLGKGNAKRLRAVYALSTQEPEGNEISATFGEIFHPDFNDPSFAEALTYEKSIGSKTAKIDYEFNYDSFFEALASISLIKKSAITKTEMQEIERLCTLYGVDAINAASLVANVYDISKVKGERIDMKQLSSLLQNEVNYRFLTRPKTNAHKSNISSDTDLALKINLMEKKSPKSYLQVLQNGTRVSTPDLKLLEDIALKFNLSNGAINALVDYILSTNNNILSKGLMEKIAGSLVREGITTALDAMNYLKAINEKGKQKKNSPVKITKKADPEIANPIEDIKITPNSEEDDDFDWDKLVKEIDG